MSQSVNRRSGRNQSVQRKRKKRKKYNYTRIAVAGVLLIIAITAIVFGAKAINKTGSQDVETSSAIQTTEPETELEKEVSVDGIAITGMSREEAKTAIMKNYRWGMVIKYNDQKYEVKDLVSQRVDALLEEIYTDKSSLKTEYFIDMEGLDSAIEAEAANAASLWDKKAHNASISGFNKDTGSFTYSGEESGISIDKEDLKAQISSALSAKNFNSEITAKASVVNPEVTEAQAKAMYEVIGTYTTKTTSNKDRNTNISIACSALDGLIIQPGEEFSFNNTTGNRTEAKGYRPAGAYQNGILVEEPGGGVCQVSSTLYNAVVFSGLTTTERHAHSYEPSYVTPGEDAMVSYDGYSGPDMKFVNSSNTAIAIRAKYASQSLTISIVGIRILEKGVTLSMHSEKVSELDPPAPEYEEDQTIAPGTEIEKKAATKGSRWSTNLITKKDGAIISNEFFHSSTYKGKPATIRRNTSGVLLPSETNPSDSSIEESSLNIEQSSGYEIEETNAPERPKETTKAVEVGPGITTEAETTKAASVPTTQSAPDAPTASVVETAPTAPTASSNGPAIPQTTSENVISPNPITQQSAADAPVSQGPQ